MKAKIFYLVMALALMFALVPVMAPSMATPVMALTWDVYPGPGTPLQDAIDAALEGDTILVHPGTYNENLKIGKSVALQSTDGWVVTIIQGDGTADVINIDPDGYFAGDVVIQGFQVRGGGGWDGINVRNLGYGASVTISENLIWDNWDGVEVGYVDASSTVTIEHNAICANDANGIRFNPEQAPMYGTATIRENIIGAFYFWDPVEMPDGLSLPGNGAHGIHMNAVQGTMTINYNLISGNGGGGSNGIDIWDVYGNVDIVDNWIGGGFIWYDEAHYQMVSGNEGDGIHVFEVKSSGRVNIEGNAISENQGDGIDFGSMGCVYGDVTIVENAIGAWTYYIYGEEGPIPFYRASGNWEHGIFIWNIPDSGSVLIEDNAISENSMVTSGIHIDYEVRGTLDIIDNTIGAWEDGEGGTYYGNMGGGIFIRRLDNTVTTISGNDISGNIGDGIDIDEISDKSTTVIISENESTYNEDGIDIHQAESGANVGIKQNFIAYQRYGIRLGSSANGIDIVCNVITGNDHGIYVKGDGTLIMRNEISYNAREADSGIHLTSDADWSEIRYNNIFGNSAEVEPGVYSYGVYKEGGTPVDATDNWWGDASGPGGSGPGIGDWVNDYVLYEPWSTEPNWMCMEGEQEPPVIEKAAASPSMVSIWWDEMFPWEEYYSVGPSCFTMWYVKASDVGSGVATVTMDWKDLLIDEIEVAGPPVVDGLIPADKLQKFIDQLNEEGLMAWEQYLAKLEAVPLEYDGELDCWYYDECCVCGLLCQTIDFFREWLSWSEDEFYIVRGEIMGQELNLGEFEVEVTVTDWKENSTIGYIPITIVDYQLPICEGWNLRSTWIALENNKWQDIVAMGDGLEADSILRWNSELQRWEQFGLGAAGYGWYYGITKVADALMEPLEAYWIHGKVNDQIGLITYRGVSAPPSRQMDAGWNLIGAALSWDQPGMRVDDALISIYEATGHCTGYTQVLSIDQYNYWEELFWICDTYSWGSYEKWFYQETWSYVRDMGGGGPPIGVIMEGPPVTRGGGYWVFMANPAVLGGFSSTPLPITFWSWWWD